MKRQAVEPNPRSARRTAAVWRPRLKTVAGIVLLCILLFPVYWMVNASLQSSSALLHVPPEYFPRNATLDGYRIAISNILPSLATSATVALGVVLLTLLLGIPAAYGLAQLNVPGGGAVLFAFALVQMLPGMVMANAFYSAFSALSLLDTYIALILADTTLTLPFAILILRTGLAAVPKSIAEAALVDGAGHWRVMTRIVIPLAKNTVITAVLFSFLFAWGDFLFAVTLNTKGVIVPATLEIYRSIGLHATDWNAVMARATLASLPAALLLLFAQRFISAGVTGSAVKE